MIFNTTIKLLHGVLYVIFTTEMNYKAVCLLVSLAFSFANICFVRILVQFRRFFLIFFFIRSTGGSNIGDHSKIYSIN